MRNRKTHFKHGDTRDFPLPPRQLFARCLLSRPPFSLLWALHPSALAKSLLALCPARRACRHLPRVSTPSPFPPPWRTRRWRLDSCMRAKCQNMQSSAGRKKEQGRCRSGLTRSTAEAGKVFGWNAAVLTPRKDMLTWTTTKLQGKKNMEDCGRRPFCCPPLHNKTMHQVFELFSGLCSPMERPCRRSRQHQNVRSSKAPAVAKTIRTKENSD